MVDTATPVPFDVDAALERVSSGGRVTLEELTALAVSPDILPIGMMADAVRRRVAANVAATPVAWYARPKAATSAMML